jgi:acetyl esterase/lipase
MELCPVVLLWHGSGPDERGVLGPLAQATAEHGVVVFVPDWRSDARDGGRAHLLESITFVRSRAATFGGDPRRVLLAGWSRGAKAAAGIAVDASAAGGWRPSALACMATGFGQPIPTTSQVLLDVIASGGVEPIPVWLLHGVNDEIVDIEHSRRFAEALRAHAWPVRLQELETDHAGIVMSVYDPERGRCVPATSGHALEAGQRTASTLALAAGGETIAL